MIDAVTASLGSLFQCLTTLWVKSIFLISNLTLPWLSSMLFPWVLSLSPENWNQCCHDASLMRACRPQCSPLIPFPTRFHSSHSHSLSSLLYLQSNGCLVLRSFANGMLYNCFILFYFNLFFNLFHSCFSLKISKAWKTSWGQSPLYLIKKSFLIKQLMHFCKIKI